jgi:GT2 family glycosyltransferase
MMSDFSISVVIPTKNRATILLNNIQSILFQTIKPDQLVIVDQSDNDLSKIKILKLLQDSDIDLTYIHDKEILGLVDAKREGVLHCKYNIIFFLDDDAFLEEDYFLEMLRGFKTQSDMIASCAVVTNYPYTSNAIKLFYNIFHRGIFKGDRIGVYGKYSGNGHQLVQSNSLSGGCSAWKKEVFDNVRFDVVNKFHMCEDIDFSTRVAKHYGNRLYINPNARLKDCRDEVVREDFGGMQRQRMKEYLVYYKKRKNWKETRLFDLLLFLLGRFFESSVRCLSEKSIKPIFGYFLGIKEGIAFKIYYD